MAGQARLLDIEWYLKERLWGSVVVEAGTKLGVILG